MHKRNIGMSSKCVSVTKFNICVYISNAIYIYIIRMESIRKIHLASFKGPNRATARYT